MKRRQMLAKPIGWIVQQQQSELAREVPTPIRTRLNARFLLISIRGIKNAWRKEKKNDVEKEHYINRSIDIYYQPTKTMWNELLTYYITYFFSFNSKHLYNWNEICHYNCISRDWISSKDKNLISMNRVNNKKYK